MKGPNYADVISRLKHWLGEQQPEQKQDPEQVLQHDTFWQAVSHLTQDEWYLVKHWLMRDIADAYSHYQQAWRDSPWVHSVEQELWFELAQMSDRSQIEWLELMHDLAQKGTYHSGEWIALGNLICTDCGKTHVYRQLAQITDCLDCGHSEFVRQATPNNQN